MAEVLRVYIETSVWGMTAPGQNRTLREPTLRFLKQCKARLFLPYLSAIVAEELERAPARTRGSIVRWLEEISPAELPLPAEVDALVEKFLGAEIVPVRRYDDARHVACAIVNEMDVVVSWDQRHIANVRKAELYRQIAADAGYEAN